MKRFPTLACLGLILCPGAFAWQQAEVVKGVTYVQTRTLEADAEKLAAALNAAVPHVIDLRGTPGTLVEAEGLLAALRGAGPTGPASLRVVLANGATSEVVRERLSQPMPGLVVLAPAELKMKGAVGVITPADNDRALADALDAGTVPASLLGVPPVKVRNDEAALAKAHAARNVVAEEFEDSEPEPTPTPAPTPPKVDELLQRAVQLQQAWALRVASRAP